METANFPPVPEDVGDWTYCMRREMQEIVPGLFLGPYAAAMKSKLHALKSAGVSHIVCIRHDMEANFIRPNFPSEFKYLVLNIADSERENIIQYFSKVFEFITTCLKEGGKALVHGNAGISRSAAIVIAFVMEMYGASYSDAAAYVQSRRFCANPNFSFANQLQEYEPIYRARRDVQNGQLRLWEQSVRGSQKRKHTGDEGEDGRGLVMADSDHMF